MVIVRRLGELELKLAKYDRGYGHGFASGLGESKSGLDEFTLFNETLIPQVWSLFKGTYSPPLRLPVP